MARSQATCPSRYVNGRTAAPPPSRYTEIGMNFDERWQRLTERHDALTQSMELFQHGIAEVRAAAAQRAAITDAHISRILDVVEKQAGNIDKLAIVAHHHEQRLDRLEGRLRRKAP